jgi:hypothetical protein
MVGVVKKGLKGRAGLRWIIVLPGLRLPGVPVRGECVVTRALRRAGRCWWLVIGVS